MVHGKPHHSPSVSQRWKARGCPWGFTLVELLVVVGIIAVLAAVSFSAYGMAIKQARKAQEIAAAHNLAAAYVSAVDGNGVYLAGYDRTVNSLPGPGGVTLSGPAAQRYPWRLGQYTGGDVVSSVMVGDVAHQINTTDTYMVSCYPAFGMNYIFVGGDVQSDGSRTYPGECITRMANSAPVLVFASACGQGDPTGGNATGTTIHGYCILTPPNLTGPMWSSGSWTPNSNPSDFGNVDFRYNGKAVCAFLDGSVQMLGPDQLRDMRYWCRGAVQSGNANYTVTDTSQRGSRQN